MNIIEINDFSHVLLYALAQLEKNTGKKDADMRFGEICSVCEAAAANTRYHVHPIVDRNAMFFHLFMDLRRIGKEGLVKIYNKGINIERIHLSDAGRAYVAKSIFANQTALNKGRWPKHLQ